MFQACLNCGGNSLIEKYYIEYTGHHIVKCLQCDLVQVNPRNNMLNVVDHEEKIGREDRLDRLFKPLGMDAEKKLKEIMEKEKNIKIELFREKIKDILRYSRGGQLLDVGSGQGAFLAACSGLFFKTFGVEPSKYTFAESQKIAIDSTIYNCTLPEASFPEESFNVVTIINTIEHILDPKHTISEVYRVLKPGGLLVIETPNIDHWIPRILGKRWVQLFTPDHVVFFSNNVLISILSNLKFKVQKVTHSYKKISIRLLLFHLRRYSIAGSKLATKIVEKVGLADKIVSIPQWDEMILFATKEDIDGSSE